MKTLYVALRYDYGDQSRGDSFEHETFLPALRRFSSQIRYFELDALLVKHDYFTVNRLLLEVARTESPDLLFCVLFENQLDMEVLRQISSQTGTVTFNWFCDDHWRYENYSRHWAACFNAVSTTSLDAYQRYLRDGTSHVFKTQWAVDQDRLASLPLPEDDGCITFVGQSRRPREKRIDALVRAGVPVKAYGRGWPNGRLGVDQMLAVQRGSAVNLNLADSQRDGKLGRRLSQVKARVFELAATGRPLLTEFDSELTEYFREGHEFLSFHSRRELVSTARLLLEDRELRRTLGLAALARTQTEHTYTQRLIRILSSLGLDSVPHHPETCRVSAVSL